MLRLLVLACALSPAAQREPVVLRAARPAGVPVRVAEVCLADPRVRVRVQVASGFPGRAELFERMVARSRPLLAVNGAYFSKTTLAPIGDLVVDGRLVRSGLMGTALAIAPDGRALIRRVRWGHSEDWSAYSTVLACGPALVLNGQVDVHPEAEGFRDPHIMGSTRRMGVGITPDDRLLIVTTLAPVSFAEWARVMLGLGCRDAMNLDAGASLALYYRGRVLIRPGRALTNLLTVHVSAGSAAAP
ncbi:MAG: phosphodiester glycosidase family protein [Chthonomonadales bacterium]|nr:phosphodiester glycosidase family protein [Chthonomonadales bacterium]